MITRITRGSGSEAHASARTESKSESLVTSDHVPSHVHGPLDLDALNQSTFPITSCP